MIEYPSFAYMDVQKTGSTFVEKFLDKHADERLMRFERHQPLKGKPIEGKIYFISVRDPLDQYSSLYRFGCSGRGALHGALVARGLDSLYTGTADSFAAWLDLVLDPENAQLMDGHYGRVARLVGFQGYRFLRLAISEPLQRLSACRTPAEVAEVYRTHRFVERILRTESLNDDLRALVEGPLRPAIRDLDAALAMLADERRINSSPPDDTLVDALAPSAKRKVMEREWFHFEVLGYPRYRT